MAKQKENENYTVILPRSGRGVKEIENLFKRRRIQLQKVIQKLSLSPTDYRKKGIEKLDNPELGQFTIRVSKGDRLFYDVDEKNKKVYILRAGKHDLYKLI